MAALREMPLDGELGRIKAPTLVIAAADDHLCPPKAADIIGAGIARSRVAVVKESGHQLPVQQPAALAKLMLEFLNSPIDTPTEAI
jgi:pimeloyl-ACP methyl ester carboxylesterase